MIESEGKRKRLTDTITRWCKHTKVDHLLREHDIPGLVGSILTEFYHVTLSCGHMVNSMDEETTLTHKDYIVDRGDMEHGGGMGEITGSYCKDCVKKYKKELGAWEVKDGTG